MIAANELRIGNMVNYLGENKAVDMVDLYEVGLSGISIYATLETIEPIPLTPAILEAAGFEKCDALVYRKPYGKYSGKNQMFFLLWLHENEARQAIFEREVAKIQNISFNTYNYINGELFHLHNLQNRFFSVTGQELEINIIEKSPA